MATMLTRMGSALLPALLLAACQTTPRFEEHFGASVRAAVASQTANPAAAANRNPVSGVDGQAARAAHERYQKSFEQPEATLPALVGSGK